MSLRVREKRGGDRPLAWRASTVGLVGVLLLMGLCSLAAAREKAPKPQVYKGRVTAIEPWQVTIQGRDGKELTLRPQEDFTEKLAVGAEVTATFIVKDGANVLQFLDYPLENFFGPPESIRAQVKKIAILPTSDVPGGDALVDVVSKYLGSKVGWFVAPRVLAEELRARSTKTPSTLSLIDPKTGEVDLGSYARQHQELIKRLASETSVDAVLEATVESVMATFQDAVASWDGVSEGVATNKARFLSLLSATGENGEVPAATLVLKLRDGEGKLLWCNRRGFSVLAIHVGFGNKFRDRPIAEVLQDTADVERWLGEVFSSFLPVQETGKQAAQK